MAIFGGEMEAPWGENGEKRNEGARQNETRREKERQEK